MNNQKRRCVIISAAEITNYSKIKTFLSSDDFYIFCDGGLNHQKKLGILPDLIIGDFDSHPKPETTTEIIQLPPEKDDTDTFFAVKEALRRGYTDFLLLGVIGNRFDHSMVNISALLFLKEHNCTAKIIDDFSEMELVDGIPLQIENSYSYFSLINITGNTKGVTIKNAKYPLENAPINASYMYALSNEVIPGKTAEVSVKEGIMLLVKVW
ncbi:MAG: thiamine diphosphokinase [Treponema sp.]|nr:thiamine diphosphokinase [Treponema sp.]